MALFKDVMLETAPMLDGIKPCIRIIGMTIPSAVMPADHYILEKFEIPRTYTEALENMAHAIRYQQVLYYMGTTVYMSHYLYMGGYDLMVEPEYIDVTTHYTAGIDRIIDNRADLETNLYVYRLICKNKGIECVSSYVAGIHSLTIEPQETYASISDIVPPLMMGQGSLYREDEYGRIMVKGMPSPIVNPRYHGPGESAKENARRAGIARNIDYLRDREQALDTAVTTLLDSLSTISLEIRSQL